MNARVKQGKVDLVFIGDSITQGWEGEGKDVWAKFYTPRNAVNLGIGGDQTQHVLWRLDHGNIDGIAPKAAVVMIGTNNSGSKMPSEQTAEGVAAIVKKLREKLPETKILLLAIFPRGANDTDELRKLNQAANATIAKLADDKHVFYLDIGDKFLEPDRTLSKEIMPDLLHLSPKGYTIWAESIEPTLKKLLGEA
jgi:beta-glucosidase